MLELEFKKLETDLRMPTSSTFETVDASPPLICVRVFTQLKDKTKLTPDPEEAGLTS